MPFVLDCSITMSWIFPDESTGSSETLLETLRDDFALVPTLWFFEVGNVLKSATRRGRIDAEDCSRLSETLRALPIETDGEGYRLVWDSLPNHPISVIWRVLVNLFGSCPKGAVLKEYCLDRCQEVEV